MFDEKLEIVKVTGSCALALAYKALGGSTKLFVVLCALMLVDTIFGWIKGFYLGNWKSKTARWGFAGKIVELMFIGVLYALDWAFGIDYLKYFGIYYFGICELASIIENLAAMNSNIPDGLVELIRKIQFSVGTAVVNKVKGIVDKFIDVDGDDDNE